MFFVCFGAFPGALLLQGAHVDCHEEHLRRQKQPGEPLGLYTIVQSPISYGVWHAEGGSVGERISRKLSCNGIAIG